MSNSESSLGSHLPTRTRQQTSSRMMKTTRRGRPFAKDTHDLFATLIVSLQLTTHRQMFKSYPNSFTTDEAAENLSALKFSQSNRAPDPNEPSRVITTTTTTTFSMNREMAKGICQHFMDARLIENAADISSAIFKERGIYMLTPKGLHILERFITKNGINGEHLLKVFSSQPICMKLLHLERRSSDDELLINTPVLYVIFRRFVGRAPNYPYGQGRVLDQGPQPQGGRDSGIGGGNYSSSSSSSNNNNNIRMGDSAEEMGYGRNQEFDRTLGVEMADVVEKPPKGSASKTAILYRHTFTAIQALDWLCDYTTVCGRDEAAELAAHFVRLGLIELVIDRGRKDLDDRAIVLVQGEDPAVPGQWTEGELRCSHKAIYTVTPLGRAIARWEGYESLQPSYLAKFQTSSASVQQTTSAAATGGAGGTNAVASPLNMHSPSPGMGAPGKPGLHASLSNVAANHQASLRDSSDYASPQQQQQQHQHQFTQPSASSRSASPSVASLGGGSGAPAALGHDAFGEGSASTSGGGGGGGGMVGSSSRGSRGDGPMEHMRSGSISRRSMGGAGGVSKGSGRPDLSSASGSAGGVGAGPSGSNSRLPRVASNQADRLRTDFLSAGGGGSGVQDVDSNHSSPSSSSAALAAMQLQYPGISANTIHAHAIALAIANEQSSYNQRDSNTNRLKQILEEPALRTLFREFLKNNFCEENLSFWLDVQDFKRRFHTTSSAVAVRATWDKHDEDKWTSSKRERPDKDAMSAHSGSSTGNVASVASGLGNVVRRLGNKALGPSTSSSNSAAGATTSSSSSQAAQHGLNAMEKHQQDLITMALVIYQTYLAPASPCELNIEHNLRSELVSYMKRVLSNDQNAKTGLDGKGKELERRLMGISLEAGAGSAVNSSGGAHLAPDGPSLSSGPTGSTAAAAAASAARSGSHRPDFGDATSSSPSSGHSGLPGLPSVSGGGRLNSTNSPYGPATLHASQLQTMVRLYERIQDHIFRLMATDSVPRFIKDARFQALVRNVEEYSVALETSRSGGIVGIGLGGTGSFLGPSSSSNSGGMLGGGGSGLGAGDDGPTGSGGSGL
ncbi:hypothetical protein OC845_003136 [Tilletia horrida]|nr:hypothetical protein OC845_003136 [Tilletia horrida]